MSKDFKIGEIVWTKLRGHPWWPSRIEDEEIIPENVLQQKPRNGNSIPVMFFGSRDYAWVSNEAIKSFEDHKKDFIKKKNTALFDKAVQQAMDPSILEKEIARERAEYEEEEEEIEEEEEEEEEEKPRKSNKRNKRSGKAESSRKRRKEESPKSKNASHKNVQDHSKDIKDDIIDKKIGDTESSEHSLDSSDLHKKKEHKHKRHGSPSNYIYLKTRARIQKLLTADFNDKNVRQKASDLLDEADRIPMTLDILKDTKIGKVVKKFSQIEINNDDLDLTKRATDLLIKWKSVVVPNNKNSKPEENSRNESSEQLETTENEISTISKISENDESGDSDNKDKKSTPMELSEEKIIEMSDGSNIKTDKDNKEKEEKENTFEKVKESDKIDENKMDEDKMDDTQ